MAKKMTIKEIVSRISKDNNGCWIWNGALATKGYGQVRINGKNRMIHKVVYESFKGPVTKDLELDHICRIKHCVNPSHLEAVTGVENRKRAPKKTHCIHGHSFEKDGYYTDIYGGRHCRKCKLGRKRNA